MATTKEKIINFHAGVEGDQSAGARELLPAMKALFHVEEVTVDPAKADNWLYINCRCEIAEPAEFEESKIFSMFFFPRPVDEESVAEKARVGGGNATKAIEKAHESYENQLKRVVGQIDAILGEGTVRSIAAETHQEFLEELSSLLDNAMFVGDIVKEKGKKVDPDDKDKDAERWADKNRIKTFYHADTWGS